MNPRRLNARTLSSLLWMVLVLVPPLRAGVERVAQALWPDGGIFARLASGSPRWVPFLALVAMGYAAVWALLKFVVLPYIQEVDRDPAAPPGPGQGFFIPTGRPDGASVLALLVTAMWLVFLAALTVVTLPWVVGAVLIVVGVVRQGYLPRPRPEPSPVPVPPSPLPAPPSPPRSTEEEDAVNYYRTYQWWFDETPYLRSSNPTKQEMRLAIPKAKYQEFKARSHAVSAPGDIVAFANADLDGDWVRETAAKLRSITGASELDELGEIHLAMAFTLSMAYADDTVEHGGEYPKFPIESLVDKRGDCEDHAILCGAVLHVLGHRTSLVLMEVDTGGGHAALAVKADVPIGGKFFDAAGERLYYCEVTPASVTTETSPSVQWWLGMEPPAGARGFRLFPIG